MSGKKRAQVLDLMEITLDAIRRAQERVAAERGRVGLETLEQAERERTEAREALAAAGSRIEALGEEDESAEIVARYRELSGGFASADAALKAQQAEFERVRSRLDEVDALTATAARQDRESREHLREEDRHMEEAGLPGEWFRDAEYRESREAYRTAELAMQELHNSGIAFDAVAAEVRAAAGRIRDVCAEARVLREFTQGDAFAGMSERIADRKAFAAIAARRAELADGIARIPADYGDWCASDAAGLPETLTTIDVALAEAEATPHPGAWADLEAALSAGAARLAELPEAVAQAEENRGRHERRARIADAIMATLDEMQFDVSFDPGSRDEPCRISGQTPRADGDGDFDIAIPLSGDIEFEVAEARGDGRDCHTAVAALRERLKERFGLSWDVTDWGNAAGINASGQGNRDRGETSSPPEKQRRKEREGARGEWTR